MRRLPHGGRSPNQEVFSFKRPDKAELSSFKHSGKWANFRRRVLEFPFSNKKSFSNRVFSLLDTRVYWSLFNLRRRSHLQSDCYVMDSQDSFLMFPQRAVKPLWIQYLKLNRKDWGWEFGNDTRPGMLRHCCRSAICVQNFDDSLSCAIRITYRSSQRSSSIHEPRDPPLKVVDLFLIFSFIA